MWRSLFYGCCGAVYGVHTKGITRTKAYIRMPHVPTKVVRRGALSTLDHIRLYVVQFNRLTRISLHACVPMCARGSALSRSARHIHHDVCPAAFSASGRGARGRHFTHHGVTPSVVLCRQVAHMPRELACCHASFGTPGPLAGAADITLSSSAVDGRGLPGEPARFPGDGERIRAGEGARPRGEFAGEELGEGGLSWRRLRTNACFGDSSGRYLAGLFM